MTRAEMLQIAKPILFNTEMVQAILEGRKTNTRRIVKIKDARGIWEAINDCRNHEFGATIPCYLHREKSVDDYSANIIYPNIDVGDILYVRETWAPITDYVDGKPIKIFAYKASVEEYYKKSSLGIPITRWHPSIHMPKSATRIFLEVTDVTVERLQDITQDQCFAEGVNKQDCYSVGSEFARGIFSDIWDSTINKKDITKYSWNANPWVWVYEFEKLDAQNNAYMPDGENHEK